MRSNSASAAAASTLSSTTITCRLDAAACVLDVRLSLVTVANNGASISGNSIVKLLPWPMPRRLREGVKRKLDELQGESG